ncbi:MAG TPA: ABC transporter ATP-binding protein [Candidatus Acidoferrum sp.]|nr:ABC transporter ATP-binding protein [Candidatus Acidoferrum sp.]
MTQFAFEIDQVSKTYPFFALKDVSLRLECGQILGFIGPNGAGKSTTIRILMGLLHSESGNVRVLGLPMPQQQVAIKQQVGFVSSDMQLYQQETVEWHMNWIAHVYPQWDAAYANELLKRFNLHQPQRIRDLSQGERMKVLHLLVLARRPRLLVLDEPTAGLDPVARHEVLAEVTAMMQDEERAVLFSSHYTQDVEQISDQIVFIDRGRIVASQDRESYLESWRRIVLDTPLGYVPPALRALVAVQQTVHSAVLTVNAFDENLLSLLTHGGATVRRVETMTLEEIFVSSVMANRNGGQP